MIERWCGGKGTGLGVEDDEMDKTGRGNRRDAELN